MGFRWLLLLSSHAASYVSGQWEDLHAPVYEPLLPESGNRRLFGCQPDRGGRSMREMQPHSDGLLWSPSLDIWLEPDEPSLRLYDYAGSICATVSPGWP